MILAGDDSDDRDRVTDHLETGGAADAGEGWDWLEGPLDLDDAA